MTDIFVVHVLQSFLEEVKSSDTSFIFLWSELWNNKSSIFALRVLDLAFIVLQFVVFLGGWTS